MEEKLKINEAARLLQLTPGALRFYEGKEIISPEKNDENSYRFFSIDDIIKVNDLKRYQGLGFSIDEIQDIFRAESPETLIDLVHAKQEELEKQREELGLMLERIRDFNNAQEFIDKSFSRFVFRESPRFYLVTYTDIMEKRNRKKITHSIWKTIAEHYNFFPCACVIPMESLQEPGFNIYNGKMKMGYVIDYERGQQFGIREDEAVKEIKPHGCFYTGFSTEGHISYEIIQPALEWIDRHQFRINGDVICKVLRVSYIKNVKKVIYEAWFPVVDKE